jgi:hypothetical protein
MSLTTYDNSTGIPHNCKCTSTTLVNLISELSEIQTQSQTKMTTRHRVQRSFSSCVSHRVEDYGCDNEDCPSKLSQRSAPRSLISPGIRRTSSTGSHSPEKFSVAIRNMELLMSAAETSPAHHHHKQPTGIERRRMSLRKKCYAGCEHIARRSRDNLEDESVRVSPRDSISDCSGLTLKDEDWDSFKEVLAQLA